MSTLGKFAFRLIVKMSPRTNQKRPFTVCIEGNIGSGKTTFLNNFKQFNNTLVLQEPVELWRNVDGVNLLDLMYKEPEKYACLFQSYVQLTMLQLHTLKTPLPYKIMERSVYSVRCFVEGMKNLKTMKEVEVKVLDQWFDWSISNANIETDLIVYLRTTPEIVYRRMRERARREEDCVSLDYLQRMHDIHEAWLYHRTLFSIPSPVITLDGDQSMEDMFVQFERCKNDIFSRRRDVELETRLSENINSPVAQSEISAGTSD